MHGELIEIIYICNAHINSLNFKISCILIYGNNIFEPLQAKCEMGFIQNYHLDIYSILHVFFNHQ